MKKVSDWINDYFAFSQTEVRGMVILLLFTSAVVGTSAVLTARPPTFSVPNGDWETLKSLVAQLDSNQVTLPYAQTKQNVLAYPFDPNTADSATFTELGLSPWIAQRVLRYRAKGGKFRVKSDFKKIYGLPEATYGRLYNYLQLPEKPSVSTSAALTDQMPQASKTKTNYPEPAKSTLRRVPLDINTADTSLLKQLPGIGSTLSARIVKYRQLLGGYHRIEQLQEVYHMSEQGAASLHAAAYVAQENQVRRLNINLLDAKTLAQHPYISWEVARAVVSHRQDYGDYRTLEDLREVHLMDEELLKKLIPYLEI